MGISNASIKEPSQFLMDGILSIQKANDKKLGGGRVIKGYMSIPKVDAENEIIDRRAYPDAIEEVKGRLAANRPVPIFIEHRRKELSLPVGSLIDAGEDEKGLWFKGKIADGGIGDSVWDLIDQGILYGCSMGGDAVKTHNKYDSSVNKDVRVIDSMLFRELSLTGLPVNDDAVFGIAKSMYCTHAGKCGSHKGKCLCKGRVGNMQKALNNLDRAIENQVITNFEKATQDLAAKPQDQDLKERVMQSLKELAQILGIEDQVMQEISGGAGMGEEQVAPIEQQPEQTPEQEVQPEQEQEQPAIEQEQEQVEEQPEEEIQETPEQEQLEQTTEPGEEQAEAQEGGETPPEVVPQTQDEDDVCHCDDEENDEDNDEDDVCHCDEQEQDFADGEQATSTVTQDQKRRERQFESAEHQDEEEDVDNMDAGKTNPSKIHTALKDEDVDSEDGEKALESTEPVTLESLNQKIEGIESLLSDKGGEKEKMELVKCPDCDTVFEKSDYPPKFCPKCGADFDTDMEFEKSEEIEADETEELEEDSEDEEVYECEHCKSTFGKSLGYEMNFCPECGDIVKSSKMSVAVAANPKGADTKYEKTPASKKGGDMSVAVATNPAGADTKYKGKGGSAIGKNLDQKTMGIQENTGPSIQTVRKGEGSYIPANTKEVQNEDNCTLHDFDEKYTPRVGPVDSAIFSNYQVDRLAKSLEDRIDEKFDSIEKSMRRSAGRKSIVPSDEPKKIEKSAEEQLEKDKTRFLAKVFLGKVKV
jgi:HK97 family phage prohead protease